MGYYTITERTNNLSSDYRKFVVLNKSNHSYCQNNKITALFNSNSWLGRRCFIIGGGGSLKGFNFNILDNELTIGINKAFSVYNKFTINYSMDSTFYDLMKRGDYDKPQEIKLWDSWLAFKGIRVFLTPMEIKEFGKEVYLIRKCLEPEFNRKDLDNGIWGGKNSGMGAVSLAIALGVSEIYLLGYDFQTKGTTHWHSGYEEGRNIENFNNKLLSYRDELELMSSKINTLGVKVYNCNSESHLKCFPFVDIKEVLHVQP